MTDDAKRIVCDLKRYAQRYADPYYCGGKLIDGTEGLMEQAAALIENLSADLESDERQYSRDAFETLLAEGTKLEADRDKWKRRAEAAERDMGRMIPCYTCKAQPVGEAPECDGCEAKPSNEWKRSHYTWRGPCAENGGATHDDCHA